MILIDNIEILSLVVTIICLLSFSVVFTILFRNYNLNAIESVKSGNEDIDLIDSCLDEERKAHSKKQKAYKIISKSIYFTIYGLVLAFFCFALTSRFMGNNMFIGDSGIVVIATGSMSQKNKENTYLKTENLNNQFDAYDIIQICKYKENEKPNLYDVIAFKAKDGRTIVHRIVEKSAENINGETLYVFNTRGDSNNRSDKDILYDRLTEKDVIGYYTGKSVPAIGSFVIFLQSNSGIITVVSIGYCILMFDYYRNKLDKTIEKRTNLLVELIDYDPNNPEVTNSFRQELAYKGYVYIFDKGEYIEKKEISDDNISKATNSKIYTKITSESNISTLKVKNVELDTTKEIKSDPFASLDELIKETNLINESQDKKSAFDSLDDLLNDTERRE